MRPHFAGRVTGVGARPVERVIDHQDGFINAAGQADVAAVQRAGRERPGAVIFGDLLVAVIVIFLAGGVGHRAVGVIKIVPQHR